MRVAVLGSCIGGDIVVKAREKDWSLCANYVSFSPLSIVSAKNNKIRIDKKILKDEKYNDKDKFIDNINNDILEKISSSNPDILLVDLSDLRLAVETLEFENGDKISYTKKNVSEESYNALYNKFESNVGCKIINKSSQSVYDLSDEKLTELLDIYVQTIYSYIDEDKVIFIKPKLANQYLSNNEILYTSNFKIVGNTNVMIDRIYDIFGKSYNYIDCPQNIIGDDKCISPFEYHFCEPYYNYMINSIEKLKDDSFDKEYLNEKLQECESAIHRLYNRIFCQQILTKIKDKQDKDIVLIAKTKQFAEMLKEQYKKEIFDYIEYNQDSDMEVIEKKIKELKSKKDNIIYVVPELWNHEGLGIHLIMYKMQYLFGVDYFYYTYKRVKLEDYIGYYKDIFNNIFDLKSKIVLNFEGFASKVIIEENISRFQAIILQNNFIKFSKDCIFISLSLTAFIGAKIIVGKKTTIVEATLTAPAFSTLSLGEDVMISGKCSFWSGDGHPIFQKINNEWQLINNAIDDYLTIGDHVWIGNRVLFLSGAKVGNGSIVGAGSLVNKKFPNNVILAGSPAKIIKKNIAWARASVVTDIRQDKEVYNNFANETIDI